MIQPATGPGGFYVPIGYEYLTVDGTVRTPTPTSGTRVAKIYFRGGNVRITLHGADPSSSVGVPFYDGYEEWFNDRELAAMRLIREGSTNGEAHIIYYR
jgi:hypothetical protein